MIKITDAVYDNLNDITEIARVSFSDPWSKDSFAAALQNPDSIFLAALVLGKVVGYIIGIAADEYAEIDSIGVSPDFRGNGTGSFLLKVFEERARQKGISSKVSLEVRESNISAIGFYLKNGFEKIGERKNFYENPRENAFVMAKTLAAPKCCRKG